MAGWFPPNLLAEHRHSHKLNSFSNLTPLYISGKNVGKTDYLEPCLTSHRSYFI